MYFHVFKKLKKRNIFFHYCAMAVIAFLFYALFASTGHATAPAELSGKWHFKVVRDADKSFQYCQAQAPYDNHLNLVFAQDRSNMLNLAIEMPEAMLDFKPMQMTVKFGTLYEHSTEASLDGKRLLVLPLIQAHDLYRTIAKSQTLEVAGPTDTIRFDLKGSSAAIAKLRECVLLQRMPVEKSAPIKKIVPMKPPVLKLETPKPAVVLPVEVQPIFEDARLTGHANIQKTADTYHWDALGIDMNLVETAISADEADARIARAITEKVGQLQKDCGPDGISFLGPMTHYPNDIRYRAASFSCDLSNGPWYESSVLFYEPKSSKLFEMSYKGSEKLSKRIDWIKEHTLKSIQDMN